MNYAPGRLLKRDDDGRIAEKGYVHGTKKKARVSGYDSIAQYIPFPLLPCCVEGLRRRARHARMDCVSKTAERSHTAHFVLGYYPLVRLDGSPVLIRPQRQELSGA